MARTATPTPEPYKVGAHLAFRRPPKTVYVTEVFTKEGSNNYYAVEMTYTISDATSKKLTGFKGADYKVTLRLNQDELDELFVKLGDR